MKRTTAVLLIAFSLSLSGAANAAGVAAIFTAANTAVAEAEAEEANNSVQFEALEREVVALPDAWKAYQQVSRTVPDGATIELQNRYRSLAVSLVLKAAMACSPDALRLLERNDVIEFRVLRSSLVTACRTAR
ncbi:hypothetical protein ACSMFN_23310 [Enterobacter sichuanensis]|uniref:hypothetical protein n=1 Tax=Enterobacter sichuanensis TaxID=2071710 RepID=UPI0021D0449F|nr:hypothetical protein [Enterobacter sichuanensis]MCU6428533.1 hypothetical protein [Enterobacter sichuanensis]